MGGSRHSKNAGTMGSESQTYHERKALGYGTVRERLGKVRPASRGRSHHARAVLRSSATSPGLQHIIENLAYNRMLPATSTTADSHCNL
jgi:hypothetical protein